MAILTLTAAHPAVPAGIVLKAEVECCNDPEDISGHLSDFAKAIESLRPQPLSPIETLRAMLGSR